MMSKGRGFVMSGSFIPNRSLGTTPLFFPTPSVGAYAVAPASVDAQTSLPPQGPYAVASLFQPSANFQHLVGGVCRCAPLRGYQENLAGIPDAQKRSGVLRSRPDPIMKKVIEIIQVPFSQKGCSLRLLCLVISQRLGAEALDEAADLGDLSGSVADVDARRGRERVVRVGALEEQVAEDAMRGGLD